MPAKKLSKVTIYDIADRVGVSGATVSRTLNNKEYVSSDVRRQILYAAEEMGYTPNLAARSLKASRTNQIMLCLNATRDYFYFDVIEAFVRYTTENGYSALFNYTNDVEAEELKMLNNLRNNFVDGLIMISLNFTQKHLNIIDELDYPVVLSSISNRRFHISSEKYNYVGVDTEKGIYVSTSHLIKLGHKKIAYAGLPFRTVDWDERLKGFQTAMADNGLPIYDDWVIVGGYDEAFGYAAGLKFAESKHLPTAICASTDMIAIGIYRAFEEKGVQIPGDVAVAGMDNTDICSLLKPKLTSVSLNQAEIVKTATELIINKLNNPHGPCRDIIFQPELIVRESCGSKLS